MTACSRIDVRQITHRDGRRDWLSVPYAVFAGDPCWVAPLLAHERQRLDARLNPFFRYGEAAFFVAYRNGVPVGRISAQVNHRHLDRYRDWTGHFGYFDCIDDEAAAGALVGAAADWLKNRGLARMIGPFNLTINQDAGLLVSGFDTRPAILTSHARPWAGALLEACGLEKQIDLFAYRMRPCAVHPQITRLASLAQHSGRVAVRGFDMANYVRDVAVVFDIFNDAWSDNWGFVPVEGDEIEALARDTRTFMRPEFGRIAAIDGSPAAMIVTLPDLNSVIAPFRGHLLPLNWARLLYGIWFDRCTSARVPLLGLRKAFRATPLAAGVLSMLVAELLALGARYKLEWIEFSWVLESNDAMRKLAELAAGPPAKVYRLYRMPL